MLQGKVCIVTGASKGIGKAIALSFSKEKAKLILVSRNQKELEILVSKCIQNGAEECKVISCDLCNKNEVEDLCTKVLQMHSHVDILVNNAGKNVEGRGVPLNGDPDEWDEMMQLNALTPMRLTRRFSPGMVENGEGIIINIASLAAVENRPDRCAYSATKWAIRGWSLCCYENLRSKNIKVVCINPGAVKTDMTSNWKNAIFENMMQPEDIAEACMLAVKTSANCVPRDMTISLAKPPFAA